MMMMLIMTMIINILLLLSLLLLSLLVRGARPAASGSKGQADRPEPPLALRGTRCSRSEKESLRRIFIIPGYDKAGTPLALRGTRCSRSEKECFWVWFVCGGLFGYDLLITVTVIYLVPMLQVNILLIRLCTVHDYLYRGVVLIALESSEYLTSREAARSSSRIYVCIHIYICICI